MRFDILGQPIEARVTSVRAVNWRDARAGGFMFVFRPGVLDRAPHAMIAPFRGPADLQARARLQRDLVARFPNVSVIDLRELLDTGRAFIRSITLGVSVVGGLVLFTGILILTGAVAMTKYRRIYEAAILRTLGASTRLVGSLLVVEYGHARAHRRCRRRRRRRRSQLGDQPLGHRGRMACAVDRADGRA